MKCPKCKKEIDYVNVYSECVQHGELEGNNIKEYGAVDEILETLDIECPECTASIKDVVGEI